MNNLLASLTAHIPVVTDGAWGTQLQALGLASGDCPDAWNLTHPDLVQRVASMYVEAGSRVILTNTFRSNRIALDAFGLAGQTAALNRAGVTISRTAAGTHATVFASMGPSGKLLMSGDVTEEDLANAFDEQARALADAGADAIIIETMSDLAEAKIAVASARATGLPVAASMVFDSGKNNDRTMMGATPEQVVNELVEAGADVIGANCGVGIEGYIPICRRLKGATDRPIWIKPNAGLPELINGTIVYKTTPDQFAAQARTLRDAGATFIGGCCGTSPAFIRSVVSALEPSR